MNINGYEPAHSGVGYITSKPFTTVSPDYRNYVTVTLSEDLVPGEHCVRFWMSLCDSSSYKTNTFHALLTYDFPSIQQGQDNGWASQAQVIFNTTAVDGNGWYLMEGSFVSPTWHRRLTLGNFLKGQALLDDTTFLGYHYVLPSFFAGYYIDDVYVGPCEVAVPEAGAVKRIAIAPNPVQQGLPVHVLGSGLPNCTGWTVFGSDGAVHATSTDLTKTEGVWISTEKLVPGAYQVHLSFSGGQRVVRPLVVY